MNRKARLFALAEALRARRTGVTAETLAERFGVTIRTIYRDLATLQDAGMPLRADRGRGGGYALDRNYTVPSVNFTAREAALLVRVAQHAARMRLVPFTDTLDAATERVRAALGASAQRELLGHMASLEFVGVPALACDAAVRRAVEAAWFEQRPLRIAYRAADGAASQRRVRVEKIVMDRAETRLQCRDLDLDAPRLFLLHRIERATVERVAPAG